jgi:transcriptional pleiotropic regulator of transition state genes
MAMLATGIIRKIDSLGRIVIPKEMRRAMGCEDDQAMEFFKDGENIVLRKYNPGCAECGTVVAIHELHGKTGICPTCIAKLVESL